MTGERPEPNPRSDPWPIAPPDQMRRLRVNPFITGKQKDHPHAEIYRRHCWCHLLDRSSGRHRFAKSNFLTPTLKSRDIETESLSRSLPARLFPGRIPKILL
ncbi:hypothetical protein RHIZ404_230485 [Rhizobium sp. EC-SD404]|nr:hypothetical protein RHIZ404_230485 [Rhizobium sp. EC-SD404]